MNNANAFVTETDAKYVRFQSSKTLLITFFVLSLFACLGFLVAWQTFAFFEIIVLICCAVVFFQKRNKGHSWKLEFNDAVITITNLTTKEEFCVYDIPASDLVVNQSKNEVNLDYCSLMIKNTVFAFGGIKNCSQLKAYIQENFD